MESMKFSEVDELLSKPDPQRVWVAQLDFKSGHGYVSVHRNRDSADRNIIKWCCNLGVDPFTLDSNDEVLSYGVSYLPVED